MMCKHINLLESGGSKKKLQPLLFTLLLYYLLGLTQEAPKSGSERDDKSDVYSELRLPEHIVEALVVEMCSNQVLRALKP